MDNALIMDLVCAAVLIAGAVIGSRRGFWKSLTGLALTVLSLIGASLIADALTPVVTDWVYPGVEAAIVERTILFDDSLPQLDIGTEDLPAVVRDIVDGAGVAADEAAARVTEAYRNAVLDAAYRFLTGAVRAALEAVSFVLLSVLLRLAVRALDLLSKLPLLRTLNAFFGGVIGLLEAALLLFLAVWLLRQFDLLTDADGPLTTFFLTFSPLSLLSGV